jgi:sugar lactone lactonase YvrE
MSTSSTPAGVECVWPLAAELGEGPIWSARERAVWFVDIKGRRVHRYDAASRRTRSWPAPQDVGFIVAADGGGLICGLKSGLYEFDRHGASFHLVRLVDAEHPRNRLNDAHVDAAGRLWFGTMDDDESSPNGALYRFDGERLDRCDDNYVITNGPATSPDGRTLYHIDTLQRVIYAFALAPDGSLSNRRVFARVAASDGYPDGPVVDAAGCVWVGLFGGWGVQRYSPAGELLSKLSLPVANCTKVAFGGDDLQTLYITTAWKGLGPGQRAQQPLAGGLFAARVDTPGLPSNSFAHDR